MISSYSFGGGRPRGPVSGVAPSFVTSTSVNNAVHGFAGVAAGDELNYFAQRSVNEAPPALPGDWSEIFAGFDASASWCVGWRKTAAGGETDPLSGIIDLGIRKRLAIYRGLTFKAGSTAVNSAATSTMIVPAKAAAGSEWAVAFLWANVSQADMEPFLPEEATDLNAGTGFLRGENQGSGNSNVHGDTGGLNAGWAEKQSAITVSNWLATAYLLEPA